MAIAQGLSDAWCQVLGRIPLEVGKVSLSDKGVLSVVVTDGREERIGRSDIVDGWTMALSLAVGRAMGVVEADSTTNDEKLSHTDW
jgi:hypothetical protein